MKTIALLLFGIVLIAGCVGQTAETGSEGQPLEKIKEPSGGSRAGETPTESETGTGISDIQIYEAADFIALSPDGRTAITARRKEITISDISGGGANLIKRVSIGEYVNSLSWNPVGGAITIGHGTNLSIMNTNEYEIERSIDSKYNIYSGWSPDGSKLAYWDSENKITVENYKTAEVIKVVDVGDNIINAVAWSPDGNQLAIIEAPSRKPLKIDIWDISSGAIVKTFDAENANTRDSDRIIWSPDGDKLAYVAEDGNVNVLDIPTGNVIKTLVTGGIADDIAWSPDGSKLASTGTGRTTIWDTSTWEVYRTFTLGGTNGIAWSSDGKRVAFIDTPGLNEGTQNTAFIKVV